MRAFTPPAENAAAMPMSSENTTPLKPISARIDAHLDAGCDVVLVCAPDLVADSLAAVEGRKLNTMALAGLIGRGPLAWEGLLADNRYQDLHARFGGDIA